MRHTVLGRESLDGLARGTEDEIAGFVTSAIGEAGQNLKDAWSDQIRAARLGERLARTIKVRVYPQGQTSVEAAALVSTKAPKIIDAYARGATIRPVNGARYLWIPTEDVPRKRQGNALTPQEVKVRFGRDLIVIQPGHHRLGSSPSIVRSGVAYAGMRGLSIRKASGRWKNATANQQTRGNRSFREVTQSFVIMFTLVPSVRVGKRLDLEALQRESEATYATLLSKHWR